MAPIQVVSNKASGTVTTCTVTLSATAAGSTLIAYVHTFGDSSSPTTITLTSGTGGGGGSFGADNWATPANGNTTASAGINAGIWVDPGSATGTNAVKVTTNGTGTQTIMVIVEEWAGILTPSPVDQSATPLRQSTAGNTTWSVGPTGTTAQANELVVGCAASFNVTSSSFTLGSPGAPWTEETQLQNTSAFYQLFAAGYQSVSSTGTFTYSGTAVYKTSAVIITLKLAAGTAVPLTDSGAGSDALSVAVATAVALTDVGTGFDALAIGGTASIPLTEHGTGTTSLVAGTPFAVFPTTNLAIMVELLLNGVWTDISAYLYQRSDLNITGFGRPDWTASIQPAQITLTLNNRDGRFTPKNPSGAYYPNITRNTQLRVSVNAKSVTSVAYSGYRFWGEVSEWPVQWDVTGADISADIVASGIWRRISQLQTTLGSAFTRYNSITLTGSSAPRSYWPMEDGAGSGQLVAFDSVAGTANAVQSFVTGAGGLSFAASTDFKGSDGIPQLNSAKIVATVAAGGTATNNCTRFLLSVPANGDSASGTTNWNLVEIDSAGTVAKFEVYLNFAGTLLMQLRNSGGTVIASGTTTTNVKGVPVLVSCELTPSGGNVAFALRVITQGAAGITESLTGTLTTASVGAVSTIVFGRAFALNDTAVGHLSETYGAVPSMVNAAKALGGYLGEKAMDRFTRICSEMGIPTETIGTASTTAAMGPQFDDHLADLLQGIEEADAGLLYECTDQFGLGYRALSSMNNQAVAATLNYTASMISDGGLKPVYDDSVVKNNITVTNYTGYTQQAILTAGAQSVLNPPNGIGNGYALARNASLAADSQVAGLANWLLNVGSVDEVRFPLVKVNLERVQLASLFAAIPSLRIGDYFQITNMPSYAGTTPSRQLVWGYSETLNFRTWSFEFNAVPETPYETGFSPGTIQLAQIPGSGATTSTAPGAGGLGGVIVNGGVTPSMLSEGITIHTLGGNAVTIVSTAPSSPNLNDIWIDSDTGLISQWNGTAWLPYKFDASATIQTATISSALIIANTIVASNIAVGTLTAALMAAGIVVAGIVNATTVQANNYLCYSGQGEFFAYNVANGWQFTVSGGTITYFVVTTAQASLIQVGDTFTWTGQAGTFTVTGIGDPFAGFVNVSFSQSTVSALSSGTVTSGSGSAGTGGLINSIAGAAGTEVYGNPYPQGLMSQQLSLVNQGSAPPAFTGASVLYSSVAGRLRYLASTGENNIIERGSINVSVFTVGNTTTPTLISGGLSYFGTATSNQSSTFEIEINGAFHTGLSATQQCLFQLFLDGTGYGNTLTIGAAALNLNVWYSYTIRFRLSVVTSGAGGTAVVVHDGTITQQAVATGSTTNTHLTVGTTTTGLAFDTTANHTLNIKAWFNGTQTNQEFDTYITRTTNYS